jgi:hypothetical protein
MWHDSYRKLVEVPMAAFAEPLVALLKRHGIEATVRADDGGGLYPSLAWVNGVWVMVPDTDYEVAARLLAQHKTSLAEAAPELEPEEDDDG